MRFIVPSFLLAACVPALAAVDAGLLALAPSGAQIISGVDVTRAKSSPFGQYILSKLSSDSQDFQEMIQETGFDPRRDVQDLLLVSTASQAQGNKSRFAVLVRGNFDHELIKKSLLAKGGTVQPYQGVDVLVSGSKHGGTAFAFTEVDIAAMGELSTVQQIIANRANPTNLDPALQQLVSSEGTDHDAWFACLTSGSFLSNGFRKEGVQQPGAEALQSILQSGGGISFGDVVEASFDAVARSAKDATSVADVIRFGASLLQTQGQKDPRASILASSLSNMTINTNQSNVHISISMPESGLEQIAEINLQHGGNGTAKPTKQ